MWGIVLTLFIQCLVGGDLPILENMISSMGRIIPYIMENKTCLKPQTRMDHDGTIS